MSDYDNESQEYENEESESIENEYNNKIEKSEDNICDKDENDNKNSEISLLLNLSNSYFFDTNQYFHSLIEKAKNKKINLKGKDKIILTLKNKKIPIYSYVREKEGIIKIKTFNNEIEKKGMLNEFYLKAVKNITSGGKINIIENGIFFYVNNFKDKKNIGIKNGNQNFKTNTIKQKEKREVNYYIFVYCIKDEKIEDDYLSDINHIETIKHLDYDKESEQNENQKKEKNKLNKPNISDNSDNSIQSNQSNKTNSTKYDNTKFNGIKNRAIALESLVNFNLKKLGLISLPDLIFNIYPVNREFTYHEFDGVYLNGNNQSKSFETLKFAIPFNYEKNYKIETDSIKEEVSKLIILNKSIVFVEVKTHFPKEKAKNKNEELKNVIELILEKVDYFMQIYEDILKIKINNINNIQIMLLYDQNKLIDYKETIKIYLEENKKALYKYINKYNIYLTILYIFPSIGKISLNTLKEEKKNLESNIQKNEEQLSKIKMENAYIKKELTILKNKNNENEIQLSIKNEEIDKLKCKNTFMEQELQNIGNKNNENEIKLKINDEEISKLKSKNTFIKLELEYIKNKNNENEIKLSHNNEEISKLKSKNTFMEHELQYIKNKNNENEMKLRKYEEEISDLKKKNTFIEEELRYTKKKNNENEMKLRKYEEEISNLKYKNAFIEEELRYTKKKNNENEMKLRKYEEEISTLKNKIELNDYIRKKDERIESKVKPIQNSKIQKNEINNNKDNISNKIYENSINEENNTKSSIFDSNNIEQEEIRKDEFHDSILNQISRIKPNQYELSYLKFYYIYNQIAKNEGIITSLSSLVKCHNQNENIENIFHKSFNKLEQKFKYNVIIKYKFLSCGDKCPINDVEDFPKKILSFKKYNFKNK